MECVPVADPSTTMALSSCCEKEGTDVARLSLPLHHQVRGTWKWRRHGALRVCDSRDAICDADTDCGAKLCSACVDLSGCERGGGVDRCNLNVSRVEDTSQHSTSETSAAVALHM